MILLKKYSIIKVQKKQKPYFKKRIGVFIMANKMTKKDYFMELREFIEDSYMENKPDMLAFIDHEIELLDKKHTSTKPSKKSEENSKIHDVIVNALQIAGTPLTITELQKNVPELAEYTCQKLSAIMNHSTVITKEIIKKKSYFSA